MDTFQVHPGVLDRLLIEDYLELPQDHYLILHRIPLSIPRRQHDIILQPRLQLRLRIFRRAAQYSRLKTP